MSNSKDRSEDFFAGDRIRLVFDDSPGEERTGTVTRRLSDREEGFSPEVEDYIEYWLEISCEGEDGTVCNVVLLSTGRYWIDGRFVSIQRM